LEHRSGALVARDLGLCRDARGERRRERDAQRGQQPAGWAPPTSRRGQLQRRRQAPHGGTSHDLIVARRWTRTARVAPRHPVLDRFVTLRLISAIQESGKLVPCPDGWDPNEPAPVGPKYDRERLSLRAVHIRG